MLIVFLIICIALIVLGIIWGYRDSESDVALSCKMSGSILTVIMVIFISVAITKTVSIPVTERQITIYEEENKAIEQEVKVIIDTYMKYEEGMFEKIDIDSYSGDKLLLLTQLYPELKANTLVQTQIELHTSNAAEIKELKKKALNARVWTWWLYFKPVGVV